MSTPPDTADRVPPGANPGDSHIQSSTPSSLARSPVGSTAPLPIACACASGTPRHESCPPESTLSDGSFLASSVLGATGASSCAISSPTSASLPGAAGAAPSLPAAARRYTSRASGSSSLMSRGPAAAASCAASSACSPAVGPPMGAAPCCPCVGGGPLGTGLGPLGTTGGAPCRTAGSGIGTVRGGDPAAVGLRRGTARGGAVACAPQVPAGAVLSASPRGTLCASPCNTPSCWVPSPGAGTGTDGGADVADDANNAATAVGPPTDAAGGTVTAC